jgi:hypothetical protein
MQAFGWRWNETSPTIVVLCDGSKTQFWSLKVGKMVVNEKELIINDSWSDCVSLWKQSTDGTKLWLQFQRSGATPLFLAVVYAPPKGSRYATEGLFDNIAAKVGMIQDLGGSIY